MKKNIALVAHDSMKDEMVAWCQQHKNQLAQHHLWGTGTTGTKVAEATGLQVTRLFSGPLGGDQQLGAMIAEKKMDVLIFFTDVLSALPHDVDIKALMRMATLYQVATAYNKATADCILAAITVDNEG